MVEKLRVGVHQEIASLKQMLESGTARTHGAFWASLADTMRLRLEALRTFAVLQSSLKLQNLVAAEVPADGNCGAWSIMDLVSGNPFCATAAQDQKGEQQKVRDQIAKEWTAVSQDALWQEIYMSLIDLFDHTPDTGPEEKPELQTPPPRKKNAKPLFVDLSTPPKDEPRGKARNVITDGAGRGAFPSKQPLPNPTFGGAPPDGPPDDPADDPPDDEDEEDEDENHEASEPELPADDSGKAKGKGKSSKGKSGKGRGRGRAHGGRGRGQADGRGRGGKKASAKEQIGKIVTEMQGGPKRKAKKKVMVKPPQKKRSEGEGKDGKEEGQEVQRRRKRKCKQKTVTDGDKKFAAIKSYLGSLGVTWAFCQNYHARKGYSDSVSGKCKEFLAWQKKLVTEYVEPECLFCLAMIREKRFNMEVLQGLVEEAVMPFKESPAWKHLKHLNETVRPLVQPEENIVEKLKI